jgi:hypothetical protein
MAASEVQICNLALSHIRSQKFIESLDENTEEAVVCRLHYADTRDLVLRRADWPFARKRRVLAQTGTPPTEWGYSYALPADCIAVRAVSDGLRTRTFDLENKYAIENDGTGSLKVILMDVDDAILIYTMQAKDPVIYPPEFVEALSWKLAAEICRPLDRDAAVCAQTLEIAERLINRAAAISYNEQKPDGLPASDFYTSRLG